MDTSPHLVVVDDEEQKRFLLVRMLQLEFSTPHIVEFNTGAAAIEYLQANAVDAVVTNFKMEPVNGIELSRWVRTQRPKLPVVMVTSSAGIAQSAKDAGASRVLDFWDYRQVGAAVRELLEQSRETKS